MFLQHADTADDGGGDEKEEGDPEQASNKALGLPVPQMYESTALMCHEHWPPMTAAQVDELVKPLQYASLDNCTLQYGSSAQVASTVAWLGVHCSRSLRHSAAQDGKESDGQFAVRLLKNF